jgi:hypothetical protein
LWKSKATYLRIVVNERKNKKMKKKKKNNNNNKHGRQQQENQQESKSQTKPFRGICASLWHTPRQGAARLPSGQSMAE